MCFKNSFISVLVHCVLKTGKESFLILRYLSNKRFYLLRSMVLTVKTVNSISNVAALELSAQRALGKFQCDYILCIVNSFDEPIFHHPKV